MRLFWVHSSLLFRTHLHTRLNSKELRATSEGSCPNVHDFLQETQLSNRENHNFYRRPLPPIGVLLQRTNLSSSVRGETEDHYHPLVFAVRCRNQSSGFQDRSYCAIAEDVGFLWFTTADVCRHLLPDVDCSHRCCLLSLLPEKIEESSNLSEFFKKIYVFWNLFAFFKIYLNLLIFICIFLNWEMLHGRNKGPKCSTIYSWQQQFFENETSMLLKMRQHQLLKCYTCGIVLHFGPFFRPCSISLLIDPPSIIKPLYKILS